MKIARVFPRRTKMTPTDEDVYIGKPKEPLIVYGKNYDEIHISVTFTWDIPRAQQLAKEWKRYGKVRIGGPAVTGANGGFVPGKYLRPGVTITSRGCPNNCWYCEIPRREGQFIRELPIRPGNVIQDNNLLACSETHIKAVFEMLKSQHRIEFAGGLQADLITEQIAWQLSELNIRHLWLSYDRPDDPDKIEQAVKNLREHGFRRGQIRCYVLIAIPGDTLEKAESRLRKAWSMGTLPFAMRYRYASLEFETSFVYRERAWNLLTRAWSRPASIKAIIENANEKDIL
ncbi:MAG: hypothetical protein ACETVZ_00285 [Phycisphaerae bacterium]